MVGSTIMTEHHAVESVMMLELSNDFESESLRKESFDLFQPVGRATRKWAERRV